MNKSQEIRNYCRYKNELEVLLKETKTTIGNINSYEVFNEGSTKDEQILSSNFNKIQYFFNKNPAIIVFGQNSKAKALFVNTFLAIDFLPESNGNWWWIHLRYDVINSFALSSGLKYEDDGNFEEIKNSLVSIPTELPASNNNDFKNPTVIDAKVNNPILRDMPIFLTPDLNAVEHLINSSLDVLPLIVYALDDQPLSDTNIKELQRLKKHFPSNSILFVSPTLQSTVPNADIEPEATESEPRNSTGSFYFDLINSGKESVELIWQEQLQNQGFLQKSQCLDTDNKDSSNDGQYINVNHLLRTEDKSKVILEYLINHLKTYITEAIEHLKAIHANEIQKLSASELEINRKVRAMKKRIKYALKIEDKLFTSLLNIKNKEKKITKLIQNAIDEIKSSTQCSADNSLEYSQMYIDVDQKHEWYTIVQTTTTEIRDSILNQLEEKLKTQITVPVDCLRQSFYQTLHKCLSKLKHCNATINIHESFNDLENVFLAACDIQLRDSCPSVINVILNSLTNFWNFILPPAIPEVQNFWQKKIKLDVLDSLSPQILMKTLQAQYEKKLTTAHQAYETRLKSMLNDLHTTYIQMEEQRRQMYDLCAPKLALVALKTISLLNLIQHGQPEYETLKQGRFGTLLKCNKWGRIQGSSVVKTVVAKTSKFWNYFAMELYKKVNLDHERIIKVRGFMIENQISNESSNFISTALFIMEYIPMNLHFALNQKMSLLKRIQIAIDVVEGIKYLHSRSLVHGNIYINSVLLDNKSRAKLNIELDFNASSSLKENLSIIQVNFIDFIVGLPIHLAPEMRKHNYNSSIDVYAFGVLFWYLCAGHVNRPQNYEECNNTDDMWKAVLKGVRPEKLASFSGTCWNLMTKCWHPEPSKRPVPDEMLSVLELVRRKIELGQYQKELLISREFKEYRKCLLTHSKIADKPSQQLE